MQRRAWKALVETTALTIAGQELVIDKMGTPRIATICASHEGVGDVIEAFMAERAAGRKSTVASLAASAAAVAERQGEDGVSAGRIARLFVAAIPALATDLIVASVRLVDDEERAEFRVWFGSLGLQDTINALMGWVGHNLPEASGPLGDALARVAIFVEDLPNLLNTETPRSEPSEPAPDSAPPSELASAA